MFFSSCPEGFSQDVIFLGCIEASRSLVASSHVSNDRKYVLCFELVVAYLLARFLRNVARKARDRKGVRLSCRARGGGGQKADANEVSVTSGTCARYRYVTSALSQLSKPVPRIIKRLQSHSGRRAGSFHRRHHFKNWPHLLDFKII